MPRHKDLKRLVRARMKKTGEAYTAARAHIVKQSKQGGTAMPLRAMTRSAPVDYAALAGMSDAKVKEKTGCVWNSWVKALDYHGAQRMTHRDIAQLVHDTYKVGDWWAQTVTVGYERIKGLRARGQRRDGSYEATKSRTFDVPVQALFDAWADPVVRRRWLQEETVRVRTATAPKSMRLGWVDKSIVAVGFAAKGLSKSSVAVQHTTLIDKAQADRLKAYWSERFDALGKELRAR